MRLNSIDPLTLSISLPIPHKIVSVVIVIVRISFDNNDVQGLVVRMVLVDEGVMFLSPTVQIFTSF
jgi:hypothetical protein